MPVAFSLIFMGMAWLLIEGGSMITAPQRLIGGIDSFPLLAVPCFILAGVAMNSGGVTDRIYGFAKALVGHFTGGLAHVNVLGSLIFSGMSGSAIADAGGLGILEIKAMKEDGYPVEFAGALTCASCIIGPLVPPSIPMVIYGVIANTSVGSLFLAGIVPGFLTAGVLMIQVYFCARKRNMPRHPRASRRELWAAFTRAVAGAGGAGDHHGRDLRRDLHAHRGGGGGRALLAGARPVHLPGDVLARPSRGSSRSRSAPRRSSGFIVAGASLFGWVLAREQVPQKVAALFLTISHDPLVILLIINVLLLFLGCIMEGLAIMILLVPVLLPVTQAVGIDPVHFGVIVVMNLMIGILTPPFGVALFVVAKVGNIPFHVLARAILPFLGPLIVVQVIVTYWPGLILFLPRLFFD